MQKEFSQYKLKKVTLENNATVPFNGTNYTSDITSTITYISGFVYESKSYSHTSLSSLQYTDVLQFTAHEEGRIRPLYSNPATPNIPTSFVYDYMIKDHLGNHAKGGQVVRMVLTEEQKITAYPAATLEGDYEASNSMVNFEKSYYKIDNTKIVTESSIPSWGTETVANTKLYYNHNGNPPANTNYPAGTTPAQTTGSAKLYKLNATSNKTGLEFMIKVMAGDKIDIFGKSYYLNTTNITNSNSTVLNLLSLMNNFLSAPGNPAAAKGISAATLNTMNSGLVPASFFRGNNSEATTQIPKAYINYIFLDEQFKFVGGSASRVGASGTVKNHWNIDAQLQNITAPKNGYIFVYVSNESNFDVFFDNLQVIHKPGPILEETHYYPFGLTMAGISSKVALGLENKFGITSKEIQNKEFSDGLGLEFYDFGARMQDPQIGRWQVIDPLVANYYWLSPYTYCNNNPIKFLDPNGMEFKDAVVDGKKGRYDIATLDNVTIMAKPRTSPADFVFRFANQGASRHAKLSLDRKDVYTQARMNGWSQQQMRDSWLNKGVSGVALDGYELGYENEMNYRASQLVAVGALGAPIAAALVAPAIVTAAPSLVAGSLSLRIGSAGADAGSQFLLNIPTYGIGIDNIGNINQTSIVANFIMPNKALGSAILGNTFNFSTAGYAGVGSDASGASIITNIGLNYGGNRVGKVHGLFLGNMLGNSTQKVFDMYNNMDNYINK